MAWSNALDLRSMSVFLEVTRTKNMAEAAKRLGMTQPAVSQYISKMEESLGGRLLDRRLRPARLTPAGEVLRDRVEALLVSAEAAVDAVRNVGEQPLPELRIAVPNSLANTLSPWLYEIVQRELKPGNFSHRAGQTADHVRALLGREVDLIIATGASETLAGIERYPLFSEAFIVMAPADVPAMGLSLHEMATKLPLIRFAGHNVVGQAVEAHLRRLRIDIPRKAEFDTAQGVAAMVANGHGFAIATPMCVLGGLDVGHEVQCVPLPGPGVQRTLHLYARGRELGDKPELFAHLCRQALTEQIEPEVCRIMPWLGDGFRILNPE